MKIKIIKSGPWQIGGNIRKFTEGQTVEVGTDVPDAIAEEMMKCGYAEKVTVGRPARMETKEDVKSEVKEGKKSSIKRKGDKK